MENRRFKPLIDKTYYMIWIPTMIVLVLCTAAACFSLGSILVMAFTDLFAIYFLITSLFGYVELREEVVFVKLGLIMSREIPYGKIREITRDKKIYSDSTVSLKCALEHVNIKYNKFDVLTVSVVGNDELVRELEARMT